MCKSKKRLFAPAHYVITALTGKQCHVINFFLDVTWLIGMYLIFVLAWPDWPEGQSGASRMELLLEQPLDILSRRSFVAKESLIIGIFCRTWRIMIRHPKGLLHSVMCAVVRMMCTVSAANEVIVRKRATNHGALLRKIAYKDKASYGSSPPCNVWRGANALRYEVVSSLVHWLHTNGYGADYKKKKWTTRMCGELLLSCAIRSSACNYTSCAHKLIYRLNWKMSKYNVMCATSCHLAAVWGRPLATIIIVHTNEYRRYLWK